MKKMKIFKILLVLLFLTFHFSLFTFCAHAVENTIWPASGLTGGGAALDGIDGARLTNGDGAIVIWNNAGSYEASFHILIDYPSDPPAEASPNTITPDTNPGNKRWKFAKILDSGTYEDIVLKWASGSCAGLLSSTGLCVAEDYYSPATGGNYIAKSIIAASGDVVVGTGAAAPGVITKGANNTFFGVNNAGTLGFHSAFNPVFVAAPASDDTYSGSIATFTAGESLAQWDVVYCKNKSGVHACYKYDANGTDKTYPPRAMAVAAIDADASGTFLLTGIVRNDGWSQTTNQDEGKIVYASAATAGAITLTKSTTSADMVAILGYVIEQNVIYFNPTPVLVEVP